MSLESRVNYCTSLENVSDDKLHFKSSTMRKHALLGTRISLQQHNIIIWINGNAENAMSIIVYTIERDLHRARGILRTVM